MAWKAYGLNHVPFYVVLAQESDTEQLRNKLHCWGWRWGTAVWLQLSERTTGARNGPGAIPSSESCPEWWLPSACVWPGSHTHETTGDCGRCRQSSQGPGAAADVQSRKQGPGGSRPIGRSKAKFESSTPFYIFSAL